MSQLEKDLQPFNVTAARGREGAHCILGRALLQGVLRRYQGQDMRYLECLKHYDLEEANKTARCREVVITVQRKW